MREFEEYPKTARLYSPVVLTEKIDGENMAICISDLGEEIWAQSRSRIITPTSDCSGFAKWVESNKETLLTDLGPGIHFLEWWGLGIKRGYGMKMKCASLFNTRRFSGAEFKTPNLRVVPILFEGEFTDEVVFDCCDKLKRNGSKAAPGFTRPEGVCVFWSHDNSIKKVPFDK